MELGDSRVVGPCGNILMDPLSSTATKLFLDMRAAKVQERADRYWCVRFNPATGDKEKIVAVMEGETGTFIQNNEPDS